MNCAGSKKEVLFMAETLGRIQEMLTVLHSFMDSYLKQAERPGMTEKKESLQLLAQNLAETETSAKKLIELFLSDQSKSEQPTWSEQEKENLARLGVEFFKKIEAIDRLAVRGGDEEIEAESNPLASRAMAAAGSVMQLLCVVRGFTQMVGFILIDATLAVTYIVKDKILSVIHLSKGMYGAIREAWRFRCA
jgi:hypothetical protein